MTVKLFKAVSLSTVLLFVLLLTCRTFCVIATAHNSVNSSPGTIPTAGTSSTISLFKPKETKFDKKGSNDAGSGEQKTYHSFTSPSIAYVDNVLVVFAQAKNITTDNKKCDIVEGYVEFKDENKDTTLKTAFTQPTNTDTLWKIRAITENVNNCTGSPSVIVNQSNIYVFFKNSSDTESSKWEYNLINGTVKNVGTNGITWHDSITNLTEKIKFTEVGTETSAVLFEGGGPGILVNKKLVVSLWYTKNGNNISTIITNTTNDGKEWMLESSTVDAEGINPAVVEWEGKLIMMTSSRAGARKVFESRDMGNNWIEAVGSISNVWGDTKERQPNQQGGKNGFITADLGEEKKTKVILFTHPIAEDDNNNNNYKLHLWLTDYKRVYDVGAISGVVEQNISSTLLYAKGNLFAAYEQWNNGNSTINITHLNDELQTIKKTLETWKTQDDLLSTSCFTLDGTLTKGSKCTNKIPTVGLVGYLSSNYSDNNWADGYLCVNATVHKGKVTNVSGGVQFSGGGAGAVWPVGAQGQNQRYHFANYNFTLLATVTINDDVAKEKDTSVLGVTLTDDNNKRIGLWCTNERKWGVGDSAGSAKISTVEEKCEKGKAYEVALIMKNKKVNVYIDGKLLSGLLDTKMAIEGLQNITHFYFGADNDNKGDTVESKVTIKNVLLYNRPLYEQEMSNLMIIKSETTEEGVDADNQDDDNNSINTGKENDTTGGGGGGVEDRTSEDADNENNTSPSQSENSSLCGCVGATVLLLCLVLWAHALWIL